MVLSFLVITGPQPVKQVEKFLVDVKIRMSSTLHRQTTKKRPEERGRVRSPIMTERTSRETPITHETNNFFSNYSIKISIQDIGFCHISPDPLPPSVPWLKSCGAQLASWK